MDKGEHSDSDKGDDKDLSPPDDALVLRGRRVSRPPIRPPSESDFILTEAECDDDESEGEEESASSGLSLFLDDTPVDDDYKHPNPYVSNPYPILPHMHFRSVTSHFRSVQSTSGQRHMHFRSVTSHFRSVQSTSGQSKSISGVLYMFPYLPVFVYLPTPIVAADGESIGRRL